MAIWWMTETAFTSSDVLDPAAVPDPAWHIVAANGDFDCDGSPDLLWRNDTTGQNCVWYMEGHTRRAFE